MPDPIAQLLRAANYAAMKHQHQRRKDATSTPYINHPLAVARVLLEEGSVRDLDLLAAALLHDTLEDTDATELEIRQQFGAGVLQLVQEVTDDGSLPKARRKQLQEAGASQLTARAKQLRVADKICNIGELSPASPAGWELERKLEYLEWGARVVAGCRGVNTRLDRLFDKTTAAARDRLVGSAGGPSGPSRHSGGQP